MSFGDDVELAEYVASTGDNLWHGAVVTFPDYFEERAMAVDTETDPRVRRQRTEQQTHGAGSTATRTDGIGETGRVQAEAIWKDARASVRSTLSEKQHSTAAELWARCTRRSGSSAS